MKFKWHFLLLTAVLLILNWFAIRFQTFYSNDTGLRFLQTQEFISSHWQSAAISYPNHIYDPDFSNVPYYYAYAIQNGALYFSISLFFPLILSFAFAMFGWAGFIVPMSFGALMTATGIYFLVDICQIKRPFLWFWASIFGTPIIFYSVQLWDHSLAVGFTTLGVALTAVSLQQDAPKRMILGGTLIGLAFCQRPEMYMFAIAAGLGLLIATLPHWKKGGPFLIGGVLGTAVSWMFNYYWIGHPLGFPMATTFTRYGAVENYPVEAYSEVVITPTIKMGRLLFHINARDPLTFSATILLLIAIILLFFGLRLPKYQKTAVLWTGFGCTAVAFLLWGTLGWSESVVGLISTFPLLPLSLVYVQDSKKQTHRVYQFVFFTALLFVALMVLIWPAFGGEQWGARYMLSAYPLLLFVAAYVVEHYEGVLKRPFAQTLPKLSLSFVALAILFQLVGVRYLYTKFYEQKNIREQVVALEADIIFTNHPFLPSFMSSVANKQFFFVDNQADLFELVSTAYDNNIRQVGLLTIEADDLSLPNEIDAINVIQTSPVTYQLSP